MLKHISAAVVAAAVTLAPLAVVAPAEAANHCVAKSEFRKVKKGWTLERVHRVFDTKGSQTWFDGGMPSLDIPPSQSREYKSCGSQYDWISVDYKKKSGVWRLSGKSAYWA